jgi:hypothetical protein
VLDPFVLYERSILCALCACAGESEEENWIPNKEILDENLLAHGKSGFSTVFFKRCTVGYSQVSIDYFKLVIDVYTIRACSVD